MSDFTWHKSTVKDMFQCSFFGAEVVNGYVKPTTPEMERGTFCHQKWVEAGETLKTEEEILNSIEDEETREILETTFDSDPYLHEASAGYELYQALDERGNAFFTNEPGNNPGRPYPKVSEPEAWIAGTMDRIIFPSDDDTWRNGLLEVTDYKTGRLSAYFRPEIVFYLLLAEAYCRYFGMKTYRKRFVYFYGRSGYRDVHEESKSFEDLLEEARQITERCEMLLERPVPTPGHHCSWCPLLLTTCPLYSTLPTITDPSVGKLLDDFVATGELDESKAALVGFALHALTTKTTQLKKALQGWSAEHGPVVVGDGQWVVSESDGDKWDQEAAHGILMRPDVPQAAREIAYGVDKVRVNRLRKEFPDLHERLFRYARLPGEPRKDFRFSKRK
jgi:hypothetical protein